jgi:serine phosphatase RsbU (regulator of sigma subunit)
MGDMATVYLYDHSRTVRRVALAHADPDVEAEMASYIDETNYESLSATAAVAQLGDDPVIIDADSPLVQPIDEHHAQLLASVPIHSAIAVPLVARGERLGMINVIRLPGSLPYQREDGALVAELAQRAAMAIDNARLYARHVEVARTLQASLLPPKLPHIDGLELAANYRAAGEAMEVGGDFYDVFSIHDDRWAVVIGDACGTGPKAAALTAQVRHTARTASRMGASPTGVVSAVNASLADSATNTPDDDERFCTMAYAEVRADAEGVNLQVVCAGHPPPVVVRADGRVEEVRGKGTLLAVIGDGQFEVVPVRLAPGDAMVMVTDGVIEARSKDPGPDGKPDFFDYERLFATLSNAPSTAAADLVAAVGTAVVAFSGGRLHDDVAIIALTAIGG